MRRSGHRRRPEYGSPGRTDGRSPFVAVCLAIAFGGTGIAASLTVVAADESNPPLVHVREGYVDAVAPDSRGDTLSPPNTFARSHAFTDAYVVDVDTQLLGDRDGDGYYRGFSVILDVDTSLAWLDVYARLYLQPDGTSLDRLHTGTSFRIYGASRGDRWETRIELLDRWRADHYDIVVEILDSVSGERLDTVGPHEFRNLAYLPLESDEHPLDDDFVAVQYTGASLGLAAVALLGWFLRIGGWRCRRFLY